MNTSENQLSPVEQEVVRRLRAAASAAEQAPRITEASTIIRTTHPSVLRRVAAFRVTTVVVAVVGITAILFFAPLPGLHLAHRGSSIPGTQSSTTIASPPVQTASLSRLSQVDSFTCLSSSWCVVETGVAGNLQLDLWNGRALTVMDTPGGLHGTAHMSISCYSTQLCAAGGFDGRAVLLVWNGAVWKFSQPPNVPSKGGAASFNGVSCPSSQGCRGSRGGRSWSTRGDLERHSVVDQDRHDRQRPGIVVTRAAQCVVHLVDKLHRGRQPLQPGHRAGRRVLGRLDLDPGTEPRGGQVRSCREQVRSCRAVC